MAYKIAVFEVVGNPEDLQTQIQAKINLLTIAAGSEPSMSVTGAGARKKCFILYRDA